MRRLGGNVSTWVLFSGLSQPFLLLRGLSGRFYHFLLSFHRFLGSLILRDYFVHRGILQILRGWDLEDHKVSKTLLTKYEGLRDHKGLPARQAPRQGR